MTYLKERMKINQNSANIHGVNPIFEISYDPPQTFHDKFHVLAVGVVATNSFMQESQKRAVIQKVGVKFQNGGNNMFKQT